MLNVLTEMYGSESVILDKKMRKVLNILHICIKEYMESILTKVIIIF